jgi:DUF4097 and DUF4098 domain-containing protein YvlB
MKPNIFFKTFFVAAVWTVVFLSLGGYAWNKSTQSDPDIYKKAARDLGIHINGSFVGWETDGKDNDDFVSANETTTVPATMSKITIRTISGDIEVVPTDKKEVSVITNGEHSSKTSQMVKISEGEELVLTEEKGAARGLKLKVEIPKSYAKGLTIESVSGEIEVSGINFGNVSVKTVSGAIKMDKVAASKAEIFTVSGDIDFDSKKGGDFSFNTISGSVQIHLPEKAARFSLKTKSGDISNTIKDEPNATSKVAVETVSGDINIQ